MYAMAPSWPSRLVRWWISHASYQELCRSPTGGRRGLCNRLTRAGLLRDLRAVRTVRCVHSTWNPAAAGATIDIDIDGDPEILLVPRRASDVTYDASAGQFVFHRGPGVADSITWQVVTPAESG